MKKVVRTGSSNTLIDDLSHKYIPYWPLLVMLVIPCLMLAWVYLKVKAPVYEVTATIKVKDEKKGVDEDAVTSSINTLAPKSIVENEVEIIHSKKFVDEVVKDLKLYAPMYLKNGMKTSSAYLSSPVVIEAEDPDNLTPLKEKVKYTYDFNKKAVQIGEKQYPINQFVSTDYGRLRFSQNPHFKKSEKGELSFTLVHPESVTEGVFAGLDVSSVGKLSSIVKFKYKDDVPQRGEDVVNGVIKKYNESTVVSKTEHAKNTMAFLDQRIGKVLGDLNSVEGRIQGYRSSKGVVNLTDQSRLYLQNVAMNDQKLADLNVQISVLDQVERYVTNKDAASGIVPSTLGVNDPLLGKLLEKYYDAQLQYEKMKQTTAENNPALQSVTGQINSLRPAILENVQNQKINLQASRNNLNLTNSGYNSVLETIPAKERELINVSREQSTLNTLYNFLLQKREQTALAYSSSIAEIEIIDSAKASVVPVSPNKMFTYGAAFILAVMLTIGYIIYRDILTNKVLFRSDIEKHTAYPLLGEISYVKKGKQMLLTGRDYASTQEEFKQLNTAAGLFHKNTDIKTILVTSSADGEGKSLTSGNLALNLAAAGKRVVLVDTDMDNQQMSRTFKSVGVAGLTEFLSGEVRNPIDVIKPTGHKNLSFIGTGEAVANTTELFLGNNWESLLTYLHQHYDHVVIDSAAVNTSSDPYIISDYADLTLYVVRHRFTSKSFVKKLDEVNELKPLKNLALVFNGIKSRGFILKTKGFGYGYKHASYNTKLLSKLMLRKNGVYHKSYKPIKQL
jgi:capsular exopolysaccharide synthesis family protein